MATPTYADEKKHDPTALDVEASDSDRDSTTYVINALIAEDHDHEIKLRTMTWQRAAWLLCGDQVCLAIMAQTWSLSYFSPDPPTPSIHSLTNSRSVLGWVPGLITMFVAGAFFYITSLTMHKFIMK
jgi:hypothetical protein